MRDRWLELTRVVVCALFAVVPLGPVSAQAVGTIALRPAYLRPAVDTLAVTVETQGRTIPFATAVESLRRVMHRHRETWEQVYRWFGNDGSRTADTLWFDATTLAPIENHRHNGVDDAVTMFSGSSVHSRLTPRAGAESVIDTTVAGPLYASGELEVLIRAAPLGPGYSATYTLYYGPPQPLRSAAFHVVRSERVRTRGGRDVECWVVDAPLSEGLNTFYVSKQGHRLVRLENHEDPTALFVFSR